MSSAIVCIWLYQNRRQIGISRKLISSTISEEVANDVMQADLFRAGTDG